MDNQPRETSASLEFAGASGNCTGEVSWSLLLCSWHPLLLPAVLATETGRQKGNLMFAVLVLRD